MIKKRKEEKEARREGREDERRNQRIMNVKKIAQE